MNRRKSYRDMVKYHNTVRAQKRRYYGKTQYARNTRKPWTEHEDGLVLEHPMTDTELAYEIGRSVGSIQQRRSKLKKAG